MDASILVHKVAALNVRDDSEIDWKRLPDNDWNLHSAHIIQRRWRALVSAIKDHEQMPFQEVVEVLLQKHGDVGYFVAKPQKKHGHNAKQYKSAEIIEEEGDALDAERPHHTAKSAARNDTDGEAESESDTDSDSST